ncbi:MAG: DnaJ domain-containing protein [Caulobacteraceae bacterium]|nr:DnaJ domain-containing protein [Caulobacteraceae bacterium]
MIYFALGCAALAFFVWIGRGRPFDLGRGWRIGAGALAVAAFAAAAFVAMRGLWGTGIVLAVMGLGLLASVRRNAVGVAKGRGGMTAAEARDLLGVSPDATPAEIKAAYVRLMQRAHPDAGGSKGLAAQLNAARDVLLKKR